MNQHPYSSSTTLLLELGDRVRRSWTVDRGPMLRDVRTRGRGDAIYVDLTVRLDGGMSLNQAHDVADHIEEALKSAHPEIVDVVVHLEPAG